MCYRGSTSSCKQFTNLPSNIHEYCIHNTACISFTKQTKKPTKKPNPCTSQKGKKEEIISKQPESPIEFIFLLCILFLSILSNTLNKIPVSDSMVPSSLMTLYGPATAVTLLQTQKAQVKGDKRKCSPPNKLPRAERTDKLLLK